MTRTILLTLLASGTLSALLLSRQHDQRVESRDEISRLKADLERDVSAESPESASPGSRQPQPSATIDVVAVSRAVDHIRKLAMTSPEAFGNPKIALEAVPVIIEAVQDLTAEELLQVLKSLSGEAPNGEGALGFANMVMATILSENDPMLLLDGCMKDGVPLFEQVRCIALVGLAKRDPDTARKWFDEHAKDLSANELRQAKRVMVSNLMRQDIRKGIDFAAGYRDGLERELSRSQLRFDAEQQHEVIAVLGEYPNPALHRALAQSLYASAFASGNEATFKEIAGGIQLDGASRERILAKVAMEAARRGQERFGEVVGWLGSSLPEDSRDSAITSVTYGWAAKDLRSAGEWLAGLEASDTRDAAASGYAQAASKVDPKAAMQWAGVISDESLRRQCTEVVLENWRQADPSAASAWVEENRMSEDAE